GLFFHRKRKCYKCHLNACSKCCQPRKPKSGDVICQVCLKEKSYKILSNQWLYDNDHHRVSDKHSGSSKVVRSLYKNPSSSASDTEVDSGYLHSSTNSASAYRPRPRLDEV
ncbi:unnamed protein product, partial [Lymnaea stagnalis]